MARLVIRIAGLEDQPIELKLGLNRVGRSPDSDFQIVHPTISSPHCEFALSESGVTLRDLASARGTFLNGKRVKEARLRAGEIVRLGEVELWVESTEARVAVPKFTNSDLPAPPIVAKDGSMLCPRHAHSPAVFQCTVCREIMCADCVHRLRRRGGKNTLRLCPICSQAVEPIGGPGTNRKKSLRTRLEETFHLKFPRARPRSSDRH